MTEQRQDAAHQVRQKYGVNVGDEVVIYGSNPWPTKSGRIVRCGIEEAIPEEPLFVVVEDEDGARSSYGLKWYRVEVQG